MYIIYIKYGEIRMKSINQRKMLFLYPEELETHDLRKIKDMLNLTTSLNFIMNEVNDFIKKIYDNYLANDAEAFPIVECSPVSNYGRLIKEFHNVRICLVKHNNVDYSSSYDGVVKMYKDNQQDISHLISLTIDSNVSDNNIQWNYDERDKYDVNIVTNMNQLVIVLVSIMMDIILYRYFNLSDRLEKRKSFSILKRDHIIDKFGNSDLQRFYKVSSNDLRKTKYLSICYPDMVSFFNSKDKELEEVVNDLINEYWKLICALLFFKIPLNDNYVMLDTEGRLKKYSKDIQMQISDVIPCFCNNQNIKLPSLLAIKKDSSEPKDCHIIKTKEDFLFLCEDEFNYYKLDIIGE